MRHPFNSKLTIKYRCKWTKVWISNKPQYKSLILSIYSNKYFLYNTCTTRCVFIYFSVCLSRSLMQTFSSWYKIQGTCCNTDGEVSMKWTVDAFLDSPDSLWYFRSDINTCISIKMKGFQNPKACKQGQDGTNRGGNNSLTPDNFWPFSLFVWANLT